MRMRRQSPIAFLVALLLIPFVALRMCSRSGLPAHHPALPTLYNIAGDAFMSLTLSSPAFSNGSPIAARFTCDGADLSPVLTWAGVPDRTQSLALIVDDPDAPMGTWTHWLLWNIPARATLLSEDIPKVETLDNGARQGINDFQRIGYGGPCPPPGKPHRYFFKLSALDARLDLKPGATKSALELAIKPHILAQSQIRGTYGR